jgi:hypothetical protein
MEKTLEVQGRVLARVVAADLTEVVGGPLGGPFNQCTSTVTGSPQGNINGSDITNVDGDGD